MAQVTWEIRKAEAIPYLETTRTMSKHGKIRAVLIQNGRDKKRAAIYTNGAAEEIGAEPMVQLICRRPGEENAIKELLPKPLINYTPGYVLEEWEEQPQVDNPEVRELKKPRAGLVSEWNRLKIELANRLDKLPSEIRLDEAHAGDDYEIHGSGNRLRCPAPLRGPQRHAPGNLGQISSPNQLPRPITDPPGIFLKRAKS